mmetsp:Transcript_149957/g.272700  ORF Transcript_149957/g.272700 Transcript_149957/m.272700 type:complete len:240 (-) Transcript_149957:8-727(-)
MCPDTPFSGVTRCLVVLATRHRKCIMTAPNSVSEITNGARMAAIAQDQDVSALRNACNDGGSKFIITDECVKVNVSICRHGAQCLVLSIRLIAVIVWNIGTVTSIEEDEVVTWIACGTNLPDSAQHTLFSALVILHVRDVRDAALTCECDNVVTILCASQWGTGSLVVDRTDKHVHRGDSWHEVFVRVLIRCQHTIRKLLANAADCSHYVSHLAVRKELIDLLEPGGSQSGSQRFELKK